MKAGRPRSIRINKKARTAAFGRGARGARTPAQVRAAVKREVARPRASWRNSQYKRKH